MLTPAARASSPIRSEPFADMPRAYTPYYGIRSSASRDREHVGVTNYSFALVHGSNRGGRAEEEPARSRRNASMREVPRRWYFRPRTRGPAHDRDGAGAKPAQHVTGSGSVESGPRWNDGAASAGRHLKPTSRSKSLPTFGEAPQG